jgi:MFS family permease
MKPMTKDALNDAHRETDWKYPGWKIVLAGFFGVMTSFAAIVPYTFGLFIKPLSLSFGWHREAISAGFTIAALTVAGASPALGILLDRFGPRRIVLPCIAIFSLALASLAGMSSSLTRFYITFFLIGLVGNGTAYIGYSRAISTWFTRRRGFALSIMLAGSGCGAMLLPAITQAILNHYGWGMAYLLLALIAFVIGFPLTASFVRERRVPHALAEHSTRVPIRAAVASRTFWIIAITVCLYAFSVNGALAHLSALLTDRGVSAEGAAYCISAVGATGLVGRLITGLFLDRFFGPRVSQIMLLCTVAGIVLLSVATTLGAGLTAAGLIGFSMGSEGDITPYLLSRYFGIERLSTLYALTWTTYAIGGATGPLFLGRVFDVMGSYRPITIQLLAVPAAIPCLLLFLLPRYRIIESKAESEAINNTPERMVTETLS